WSCRIVPGAPGGGAGRFATYAPGVRYRSSRLQRVSAESRRVGEGGRPVTGPGVSRSPAPTAAREGLDRAAARQPAELFSLSRTPRRGGQEPGPSDPRPATSAATPIVRAEGRVERAPGPSRRAVAGPDARSRDARAPLCDRNPSGRVLRARLCRPRSWQRNG